MSDDFDKDDLSWLRGTDDNGPSDDDEVLFDWQSGGDDPSAPASGERTGLTGQLRWQGDQAGRTGPADDDLSFEWDSAGTDTPGGSARTGLTGQLSWHDDQQPSFEDQLDAAEDAARQSLFDQPGDDQVNPRDFLGDDSSVSGDDAGDLPPWMSGMIADNEPAEDGEEEDSTLPEWMRASMPDDLADDDSDGTFAEQLPAWMQPPADLDEDESGQTLQAAAEEAETLPEWMRSALEDDTFVSAEDDEPDQAAFDDDALPEWMRGSGEPAVAGAGYSSNANDTVNAEDDTPDWLRSAAPVIDQAGDTHFDNLFGDSDFAVEEEPEFDLLGELASGSTGVTGLLSQQEDADDQSLDDLFGISAEPAATLPDSSLLNSLDFGDDPFDFQQVAPDLDTLFGIDTDAEDDGQVDWFAEETAPVAGDQAEWLGDLGDAFAEPADEEPDLFGAGDEFLANIGLDAADLQDDYAPRRGQPSLDDLDAFLASIGSSDLALPVTGELPQDTNVDFDNLFFDEDEPTPAPAGQKQPAARTPSLPADSPDWLAGVSVGVSEISAASLVRKQTENERPLDELPDRLKALHERGMALPTAVETVPVAGAIASLLPAASILPPLTFQSTAAGTLAAPLSLSADQAARANMLRSIADLTRPEAQTTADRSTTRRRIPLDRVLIALLLTAAVLLPFFVDDLQLGDLPPNTFTGGTRQGEFFTVVESLPSSGTALIAVEYGPTGAAELDSATEALLRHLLLRNIRPVLVGGNAIGLLRAANRADQIAAEQGLTRGEDYIVGRYLLGEAIGLRDVVENIDLLTASDMFGEENSETFTSLDDFSLIVVIAERADSLRNWAEQVAPNTTTPMLAVTGFAAAPLAEPYVLEQSQTFSGLLIGYADALTYRQMIERLADGESLVLAEPPTPETPEPAAQTPELTPESLAETAEATDSTSEEATAPIQAAVDEPTLTEEAAASDEPTPSIGATPTARATPSPEPTSLPTMELMPPTDTATPTPTATIPGERFAVVIAAQTINVRSEPTTQSQAVGSLQPGARVPIVDEQIGANAASSWYQVRLDDDTEGWIRGDLLRVEEVPVTPTLAPTEEPTPTREASGKRAPGPVSQQGAEVTPTPQPFELLQTAQAVTTAQGDDRVLTAQALATTGGGDLVLTAQALATEGLGTQEDVGQTATEGTPDNGAESAVPSGVEDTDYSDDRWYAVNLGIIAAAAVIAFGNMVNVARALLRRARDRT